MEKISKSGHGIWYAGTFLILGLFGAILRGQELARHYDRATALFEDFAASPVLPVYTAVCLAAALVCSLLRRDLAGRFVEVYRIQSPAGAILRLIGGLGLAGAGVIKSISALRELLSSIQDVRFFGSIRFISGLAVAELVFGLLTILAGIAFIILTQARLRQRFNENARFFSIVPIFWSCFLLVMTFMEHPVEPVLRSFAYDLLAGCALVLAIYRFTARAYGKLERPAAVFTSLAGIMLLTLTVGGRAVAAVITGEAVWVTEVAFRLVVFSFMDLILLLDVIPLLNAERYNPPASNALISSEDSDKADD